MFLLHNLNGKTMLVFIEVDLLMILIGNWPCDNVFCKEILFVGVLWRSQFPCGQLVRKTDKIYKVRLQINLTVRGRLIYK